jgi:hypothetical protein
MVQRKEWKFILNDSQLKDMYRWLYRNGKIDFHFSYNDFIIALVLSNNNPRLKSDKKAYILDHTEAFYAAINNLDAKKAFLKRNEQLDMLAYNLQNTQKELSEQELKISNPLMTAQTATYLALSVVNINKN